MTKNPSTVLSSFSPKLSSQSMLYYYPVVMSFAYGGTSMFEFFQRNNHYSKPIPSPNVRRPKPNDMTIKEIKIQEALGTLPFREYMKREGMLFENNWWYFPIPKTMKVRESKTVTIDDQEHYPVADSYIEDLQYSMNWNKWSEETFANEVIKQCYQCMGMKNRR